MLFVKRKRKEKGKSKNEKKKKKIKKERRKIKKKKESPLDRMLGTLTMPSLISYAVTWIERILSINNLCFHESFHYGRLRNKKD